MANWQIRLNLGDVYHADKPIPELAGIVAARLRGLKLPPRCDEYTTDRREELATEFSLLSEDPTSNADDFDEIMAELYDWADTPLDGKWNGRKLCWVDTLEPPLAKAEGR